MFESSKSEKIEVCDVCFGEGKIKLTGGRGNVVLIQNDCARCNGTGRILIIETKKIVAFGSE